MAIIFDISMQNVKGEIQREYNKACNVGIIVLRKQPMGNDS